MTGAQGYEIYKSEAKDGIYLKTNLLGPPKTEEIIEGKTYPYVIVKMEYSDKNVVFD